VAATSRGAGAGRKGKRAADPAGNSLSKRINRLFRREDWQGARRLIERALKDAPEDHWLLTRLSTTYYEQGDYEKALGFAERARDLAPNCPLVLWDLAGALQMLGRHKEAILAYKDLVQRGPEALGQDECGEGFDWALALLADSIFRIGISFQRLRKKDAAVRTFLKYLALRHLGAESIYDEADAEARIEALNRSPRQLIKRELDLSDLPLAT
jgi:tetratricopeptide (TPR) repeat protein